MRLGFDPIAYINATGSACSRLELSLILGRREGVEGLCHELGSLQNSDGSWPWQWKQGNPGGVLETARAAEALVEYMPGKVWEAATFLHSMQRDDGGWSENPGLIDHIPREWVFWRTDCSSAFFTGEVVCALITSGHGRDSASKGIDYLKATQNGDGGWPLNSDPTSTKTDAICTNSAIRALLAWRQPKDGAFLHRALESIKSHYETWMNALSAASEPWVAAALLDSLARLEPEKEHADVVKYILTIQRQDGGWGWQQAPSDPDVTLRCVKALITAGAVELAPS